MFSKDWVNSLLFMLRLYKVIKIQPEVKMFSDILSGVGILLLIIFKIVKKYLSVVDTYQQRTLWINLHWLKTSFE